MQIRNGVQNNLNYNNTSFGQIDAIRCYGFNTKRKPAFALALYNLLDSKEIEAFSKKYNFSVDFIYFEYLKDARNSSHRRIPCKTVRLSLTPTKKANFLKKIFSKENNKENGVRNLPEKIYLYQEGDGYISYNKRFEPMTKNLAEDMHHYVFSEKKWSIDKENSKVIKGKLKAKLKEKKIPLYYESLYNLYIMVSQQ